MENRPLYPAGPVPGERRARARARRRGTSPPGRRAGLVDPSVRPSGSPSSASARGWPASPTWSWPDPAEGRAGSHSQEIHHVRCRP